MFMFPKETLLSVKLKSRKRARDPTLGNNNSRAKME